MTTRIDTEKEDISNERSELARSDYREQYVTPNGSVWISKSVMSKIKREVEGADCMTDILRVLRTMPAEVKQIL